MLLHGARGVSGPDIVGPSRGESGTMLNGAREKTYFEHCVLRIKIFEFGSNRFASTPTSERKKREEEEGRGKEGPRGSGSPRVRNCFSKKKLSGTSEEEKRERCQNLPV